KVWAPNGVGHLQCTGAVGFKPTTQICWDQVYSNANFRQIRLNFLRISTKIHTTARGIPIGKICLEAIRITRLSQQFFGLGQVALESSVCWQCTEEANRH